MLLWKEVSWNPLASIALELGWKHFRATETFGAIKNYVFVWELIGLILVDFSRRIEL